MYELLLAAVIIVLIVLIFRKYYKEGAEGGPDPAALAPVEEKDDRPLPTMPPADEPDPTLKIETEPAIYGGKDSDMLITQGEPKADEIDYSEAIKLAVLDPSVRENHNRFAADVAKYSSGAGYTTVAEENRTATAINWVGFSRPRYIPRRKGLLQQLSEDEREYYGNRILTW